MSFDNNISEFPRSASQAKTITLDDVVQSMSAWRANKSTRGTQIPDDIWESIFALVEKYPDLPVCNVLGVTKMQFQRKMDELQSSMVPPTQPPKIPAMDFCEVREASPSYKPARIPATNTLIVEFCRSDGRIMKIHTTTDSFAELMKAFFSGG